MTPDQKQAVLSLASGQVSATQFLDLFGSTDGEELCCQLLADAVRRKDGEDADLALVASFKFGFSSMSLGYLLELMSADWHYRHEDVVTALGALRSTEAVYALFFATQWIPRYLEFDDARALATKALWALGDIPGERATNVLAVLAGWDDLIVREGAAAQLERRQAS